MFKSVTITGLVVNKCLLIHSVGYSLMMTRLFSLGCGFEISRFRVRNKNGATFPSAVCGKKTGEKSAM